MNGEIKSFTRKKEKWMGKYLKLLNGIPIDDTFRIVTGINNSEYFFCVTASILMQVVDGILQVADRQENIHEKSMVSVDRKVSWGLGRKTTECEEVKAFLILNVYSNDYGICLCQKFIGKKTNEIPAVQEVLRMMDLKDMIITMDAMNC